ncbi:MAG TPA: DsbA family protein [Oscillatoriaceae cyanobacterium]
MAAPIRIDYFTDPYCAWSWALEPTLTTLIDQEGGSIQIFYHMLPLVADLAASGKTGEDIARGWEHIAAKTGMTINSEAWLENPPASTLPACRAVKAAEAEGIEAAGRYLRALRPLLMMRCRVADTETLLMAAEAAQISLPDFKIALEDTATLDGELETDRQLAKAFGVLDTPALVMQNAVRDKILIEGPRDLELIERAVEVLRTDEDVELPPAPRTLSTELIPEPEEAQRHPRRS